jgi:hypothetical protein
MSLGRCTPPDSDSHLFTQTDLYGFYRFRTFDYWEIPSFAQPSIDVHPSSIPYDSSGPDI